MTTLWLLFMWLVVLLTNGVCLVFVNRKVSVYNLQSAIIEPVRDALAYYTEMQRALEEEKAKKDSLADSMEADKNGLLPAKLNNGSDDKEQGGMKTLTLGHSLTLTRNNSSNLRRGSTTRLTSKHSMELETSPSWPRPSVCLVALSSLHPNISLVA